MKILLGHSNEKYGEKIFLIQQNLHEINKLEILTRWEAVTEEL
jgi:hypothetical protein